MRVLMESWRKFVNEEEKNCGCSQDPCITYGVQNESKEKEEEEFSKDLSNILQWMEDLKKVDVSDVEPVRNVNDSKLFEREDVDFTTAVNQEDILLNAPKKNGKFFTVPKVIEKK